MDAEEAFRRGDYREAARLARQQLAGATDEAVRMHARTTLARFRTDPLVVVFFAVALAFFGITIALSGCHAPAPDGAFHWRAEVRPSEYFPLGAGAAWSYDVTDPASGERILFVNHVLAVEGKRSVFAREPDPIAYEDRGDRIVRLPSETVILRAPIARGSAWDVPGGGARILAVDGEVNAGGTRYTSCLLVEEATPERRVVTTYAPAVGPVAVEIYARGSGGDTLVSRALLRSFHAPGATLGGP